MSSRCEALAKVHDALGLFESQRTVHRVAVCILEKRVGCKFAATPRQRPPFSLRNESARDALATVRRGDIDPFEECDGRRLRAVHVIASKREFDKALRLADSRNGNELRVTRRRAAERFHFGKVCGRAFIGPERLSQLEPAGLVSRRTRDDHASLRRRIAAGAGIVLDFYARLPKRAGAQIRTELLLCESQPVNLLHNLEGVRS